jgi:hypothetical protein
MRLTKKLPDNYINIETYDPKKYRKALWLLFALAALITIVGVWFLNELSIHSNSGVQTASRESISLTRITFVILFSAILLLIHEMIHALFFRIYTNEWPKISIHLYAIQVYTDEWYIPRDKFIVINMAPIIILTLLGGILIPFFPEQLRGPWILGLIVNAGGSTGDLASSLFAFFQSDSSFLTTKGSLWISKENVPDNESHWRGKIRLFLEKMLSKLKE